MSKRFNSDRKTGFTREEEAAQRAEDLANIVVDGVPASELLRRANFEVPRVRTDLVVKQTAAVPDYWALADRVAA